MTRRALARGVGLSLALILTTALHAFTGSSPKIIARHSMVNSAQAGSLMWADDFNDGDAGGWIEIEGSWEVIGGAYRGEHTGDGRSVAGDFLWSDYRFEGVMMFDSLNNYEATVLFRVMDVGAGPNIGHYYEFANYSGLDQITLWIISNGAADLLTVPYTFDIGIWYRFAVEVWDSHVRYYINDMLVAKYDQLTHYTQGRIGVKSFISAAWFDDLEVAFLEEPAGIPGGSSTPSPALVNFTNYPNPFRDQTTISFDLGTSGRVGVYIYDVSGRWIRTLYLSPATAGPFRVDWDGRADADFKCPSGVYFCRVVTDQGPFTHKLIKVR